jgi:putative membrane protein
MAAALLAGTPLMLWIKSFHVLFVMSWMAGIFYLPRIFVHYAEGAAAGEDVRRLVTMARRLYGFMTIMAVLALGLGTWLWLAYYGNPGLWLQVKLAFVLGLVGYHLLCRRFVGRMASGAPFPSGKALRWFNEGALALALPIILMAVLKPT